MGKGLSLRLGLSLILSRTMSRPSQIGQMSLRRVPPGRAGEDAHLQPDGLAGSAASSPVPANEPETEQVQYYTRLIDLRLRLPHEGRPSAF